MKKGPSQAALAAKRKREHEEALQRMHERDLKEAAYREKKIMLRALWNDVLDASKAPGESLKAYRPKFTDLWKRGLWLLLGCCIGI